VVEQHVNAALRNGLAEAYLLAAEQSDNTARVDWLRKARRAHLERAEAILAEIGAEWDLARAREALGGVRAI